MSPQKVAEQSQELLRHLCVLAGGTYILCKYIYISIYMHMSYVPSASCAAQLVQVAWIATH